MRLRIDDNYTVAASTKPDVANRDTGEPVFSGMPVVNYSYRPALPDALADWRYARNRAVSGRAEVEAAADLVVSHLATWDIEGEGDRVLPITTENVRRVPEPILDQIVTKIATWAPKAVEAAGNLHAG